MQSARHTVVELQVDLGKSVLCVDRGVLDIVDGGGLDDGADNLSLDGLVLRGASTTVGAADRVGVSSSVLVTSVVAALLRHLLSKRVPK